MVQEAAGRGMWKAKYDNGLFQSNRRHLRVIAAAVDGTGRMDLDLPIGADASLLGLQMNVQGAFRTSQGLALTEHLERPYVLR